jgi:hypothetical protein
MPCPPGATAGSPSSVFLAGRSLPPDKISPFSFSSFILHPSPGFRALTCPPCVLGDVRYPVHPWNLVSTKTASFSIERSDTLQIVPAIHPDHEPMSWTFSGVTWSSRIMSAMNKRPPARRTRKISRRTLGLSRQRLKTPLEIAGGTGSRTCGTEFQEVLSRRVE